MKILRFGSGLDPDSGNTLSNQI